MMLSVTWCGGGCSPPSLGTMPSRSPARMRVGGQEEAAEGPLSSERGDSEKGGKGECSEEGCKEGCKGGGGVQLGMQKIVR